MFTRASLPRLPGRLLPLLAAGALWLPAAGGLRADVTGSNATASPPVSVTNPLVEEKVALDEFEVEGSYVGQAAFSIKRFNGAGASTQQPYRSISESQFSAEYAHRFPLFGKVYLRIGAEYERFDFSTTTAPLPSSLQKLGGSVGVEYVEQGHVGAFLHIKPGVYYSDFGAIGGGNFDVTIDLGCIVPVTKKFYLLVGARSSLLAKYPVLPFGGAVLLLTDKLRIEAVPPEPKLIYSYSEQFDFYVGAELLGDSYKRDAAPDARPLDQRFNKAVLSFSETRVGAGVTITPTKAVDIDLAAGWSLGRDFDYYRGAASKRFVTEGAPYGKVSVSVEF